MHIFSLKLTEDWLWLSNQAIWLKLYIDSEHEIYAFFFWSPARVIVPKCFTVDISLTGEYISSTIKLIYSINLNSSYILSQATNKNSCVAHTYINWNRQIAIYYCDHKIKHMLYWLAVSIWIFIYCFSIGKYQF